jgi:hypothetical protein
LSTIYVIDITTIKEIKTIKAYGLSILYSHETEIAKDAIGE